MAGSMHVTMNTIRSAFLIGLTFAIIFGLFYVGALLFEMWSFAGTDIAFATELASEDMADCAPYVAMGCIAWMAFALIFNGMLIRNAAHCRLVTPGSHPKLEIMLRRLCLESGMDVPQLGIIDSDAMNAFATGLFAKDYTVAFSRGLLEKCTDEEIEGVAAHELAHIKHRDVMLGVMAATVAGGIGMLAELLFFLMRRCGKLICGEDEEEGGISAMGALAIGFVFVLVAWFVSVLANFAFSRAREYLADAEAAKMTGNPQALASALSKIVDDNDIGAPSTVMALCFDRPPSFMDLFSTHPPPDKRIEALEELAAQMPARRTRTARTIRSAHGYEDVRPRGAFGLRGR